jgi:uncharacterized protein YdaL
VAIESSKAKAFEASLTTQGQSTKQDAGVLNFLSLAAFDASARYQALRAPKAKEKPYA